MTPYAWGEPVTRGVIRQSPEDFRVIEELGHEPDGSGEHLWLWVEKRERNTVDVAVDLARCAQVHPRRIGFAGLKDRRAVTRQYFSIHLPGQADPDWSGWDIPGVRILEGRRCLRKIQRGRLIGNRFELVVRAVSGARDRIEERLVRIADDGVPNGFGEQRFGGNNVARAYALFRGALRRKPSGSKRGFYLSAARSLIFNRILAERIEQGSWNELIPGDLAVLDGSRSFFRADANDPEQRRRVDELDIHPSGALAGAGDSPAGEAAAALENRQFEAHRELVEGLARFGMRQERRALRMRVAGLEWSFPDDSTLQLAFSLHTGSYATSVLRELVDYQTDHSQ
ncbi:MAG: tRNA pseudouridine(13) synthase TruD [Pseudomonadota bacterium]|nr:MAG: tRNA pseudouridine(13) synthase TruD [Pseudomonadota bacterium]